MKALVQEGHLAKTLRKRAVVVDDRLGEHFGVGPKRGLGSRSLRISDAAELFHRFAALKRENSSPSRLTSTSRRVERALTQETPTPWRPPKNS